MFYRDYFPRRILFQCGVSPDKVMPLPGFAQRSADGYDEIKKSMSDIYSVFARSAAEKNTVLPSDIGLDRRIVSAFYDMDILNEGDRAAFPEDYKIEAVNAVNEERMQIDVAETEEPKAEVSLKVEQPNLPQRGKTL